MILVSFIEGEDDAPRLGLKVDRGIVDVRQAATAGGYAGVPTTLRALLDGGLPAQRAVRALVEQVMAAHTPSAGTPVWLRDEASLVFAPCVPPPEKILCVGLNYRRHAEEAGHAVPEVPILFSKFNNTLAAHQEPVPLPDHAEAYDYEVELGVVVGRTARYVPEAEALDYVFGYCTLNDLSVRDLQMRTSQWLLGKTLDKFLPAGPYLVTADAVPDPQRLTLRCSVNGVLRQDSNTADMIFSVAEIISYASRYMTLRPGDLIATGTPEGVILGRPEKDWLRPGDEVAAEVEPLGRLVSPLIAEAPARSSA